MSKRRDVFLKSMARTCVTFALIIIVSLGSRGAVLYFLSIEPFSPEPMAQGPGSARWCGKDGCGVGVARTGAAYLALPRTFPRHHANPSQSGGFGSFK